MLQIILIINTIYCELVLFPLIKAQDLLERCFHLFQKIYEDKFYHPNQELDDSDGCKQVESNYQEVDVPATNVHKANQPKIDPEFDEKGVNLSKAQISHSEKENETSLPETNLKFGEKNTRSSKMCIPDDEKETEKNEPAFEKKIPKILDNNTYFISHKWIDVVLPYDVAEVELKDPYFLDYEDVPQYKYTLVTNYDMFKGKGIHDREVALDEVSELKILSNNYAIKILWNENKTIFINLIDGSSFDIEGLYVIVRSKPYMTSKVELKEHLKKMDIELFEFDFHSTLTSDQIDTFFTYYEHKILFVFWYKILFLLILTEMLLVLDIIFLKTFLIPLIIIILIVMGLQPNKYVLFKDEVTEHVFLNIKTFFSYFFSTFGLTATEFNTKKGQHGDIRKFILRSYLGVPGLLLLPLNVVVFSVSSYMVIFIQIFRAFRSLYNGECREAFNELRHYIRSTGLLLI
jgi:hypothetical protein